MAVDPKRTKEAKAGVSFEKHQLGSFLTASFMPLRYLGCEAGANR